MEYNSGASTSVLQRVTEQQNGIWPEIQGGAKINRTIQPFNRVYKNLHKITPLTTVAHRQIRRQKRNVHLNILR